MTFRRHSDVPEESLEGLLERGLRMLREYSRRRGRACLRCGRPYSTSCRACGAKICERCSVLSIETGTPAVLCLDCTRPSRARPAETRFDGGTAFRTGVRTLLFVLVSLGMVSYWQRGWAGPWRIMAILLQPAITLGLVPLAFLLGAGRIAIVRALHALFTDRSSS